MSVGGNSRATALSVEALIEEVAKLWKAMERQGELLLELVKLCKRICKQSWGV